MKKVFAIALLAAMLLPALSALAAAQPVEAVTAAKSGGSFVFPAEGKGTIAIGVSIGLGLIIMGAGKGIGNIGSHATDAIARQPEAGGRIFTTMIISAALIEGVTLFAIVVALLTMIL